MHPECGWNTRDYDVRLLKLEKSTIEKTKSTLHMESRFNLIDGIPIVYDLLGIKPSAICSRNHSISIETAVEISSAGERNIQNKMLVKQVFSIFLLVACVSCSPGKTISSFHIFGKHSWKNIFISNSAETKVRATKNRHFRGAMASHGPAIQLSILRWFDYFERLDFDNGPLCYVSVVYHFHPCSYAIFNCFCVVCQGYTSGFIFVNSSRIIIWQSRWPNIRS